MALTDMTGDLNLNNNKILNLETDDKESTMQQLMLISWKMTITTMRDHVNQHIHESSDH